jgi:hypothetical protein
MPRKPIDYSKGLIYKIVCKDLECKDIYVGSSTNFTKRKTNHKSNCYNENQPHYNLKLYQTIRQNGGWDNWEMLEVEKYPCNDGNELRARERVKYEELKANMNIQYPNRTIKEWNVVNKDKKNKQWKKYFNKNKDKINSKKRQTYNENKEKISEKRKEKIECECGLYYTGSHKLRHQSSNKHIQLMKNK